MPWPTVPWLSTARADATVVNHYTTDDFWACYQRLPEAVQSLADANYQLLRADPKHPSLHFKRIGHRALAVDSEDGPVWIGSHADYDGIIDRT